MFKKGLHWSKCYVFVLVLVCILSVCPSYSFLLLKLCKWLTLILLKVCYSIRNFTEMCHSVHLCCLPPLTGTGCFPSVMVIYVLKTKPLSSKLELPTQPKYDCPVCSGELKVHIVKSTWFVVFVLLTVSCNVYLYPSLSFQTATRDSSLSLFRKCK